MTFDKGDYLDTSGYQCINEENQGWLQNDKELKIHENWGTACENSSYGSGLMAEYVLLTQVPQI